MRVEGIPRDILIELEQLRKENDILKNAKPSDGGAEKYLQMLQRKEEELVYEKKINAELEKNIFDCNQKMVNLENANKNSAKNNKLLLDNNTINRNNNKKLQSQNKKLSLELYKLKVKRSMKKKEKIK